MTAATDRVAARIAEDLQRQWQWLTRPFFLSSMEPAQLMDYSRFLRGVQEHLRRIKEQPAARELERIDTLNAPSLAVKGRASVKNSSPLQRSCEELEPWIRNSGLLTRRAIARRGE